MRANVFWVPGAWRGRLGILPRPRGGDWLRDETRTWREAGVDVVVSLLPQHTVTISQLVDWAERAMMEGEFDPVDHDTLRDIAGRIGVAGVRAFGLTWEDCEAFLSRLGYRAKIDVFQST